MNLFAYGSLMFEPVWSSLVKRPRASMRARLDDFERQGICTELYPGLVRKPGACTEGRLWLDLSATEIAVLDAFEGAAYDRQSVQVAVSSSQGGQTLVAAQVYVFKDVTALTGKPWDASQFYLRDLDRFLAQYQPAG
ncbi:MAG: hypothetical protein RLZZ153_1399 [Pseudomonadota bacterium]|jgi:gamma-glutamylcyclotransferase (GGCT)/AIG2-like uncharacterized protein YtfP